MRHTRQRADLMAPAAPILTVLPRLITIIIAVTNPNTNFTPTTTSSATCCCIIHPHWLRPITASSAAVGSVMLVVVVVVVMLCGGEQALLGLTEGAHLSWVWVSGRVTDAGCCWLLLLAD